MSSKVFVKVKITSRNISVVREISGCVEICQWNLIWIVGVQDVVQRLKKQF